MASSDSTDGPLFPGLVASVRSRHRVLIAGAVLAVLGFLGAQAWRHARVSLREDPRYRVTAASIDTPPTPPWIRTDIRLEVLRDARLRGDLSVLDPPDELQKKLADAFAFHPWVETVGAVTKRPPNRIAIELTYRRPVAAVQQGGPTGELIAIDAHSVRLPRGDLTDTQLRYLPRIIGIDSTTLAGEVWPDSRVQGAVSLVAAFGPRWSAIGLVDIVPRRQPEFLNDLRYPVFDLVTGSQTRIVWGAAPNATPPGEAPFAVKLARLETIITRNGALDNNRDTPGEINVRDGLTVRQRQAKKPGASDGAAPRTASKPAEPAESTPAVR